MTYDVTRLNDGHLGTLSRRGGRAVANRTIEAQIRVAGLNADTDVAVSKIDNQTLAVGAASTAVVRVALAQRHLEQLAPEVSGRLAFLADDHLLGCAEVLADLRRDHRRR